LWWRRIIRVVPASLRDHDDKPPRARRRKRVAHQNNTVRAGIIALYNIFLIELKEERSKTSERRRKVGSGTFVGILTDPFGVIVECIVHVPVSERVSQPLRLRRVDPDHCMIR
jgi:hypothetical protein